MRTPNPEASTDVPLFKKNRVVDGLTHDVNEYLYFNRAGGAEYRFEVRRGTFANTSTLLQRWLCFLMSHVAGR